MLALLLASLAFAETLTAPQPVACARWPGEKGISLALQAGDEVEVVAREGTLVRVRKGTEYGWVDQGALTPVASASPAADAPGAATDASKAASAEPAAKKAAGRKRGKRRPSSGD